MNKFKWFGGFCCVSESIGKNVMFFIYIRFIKEFVSSRKFDSWIIQSTVADGFEFL